MAIDLEAEIGQYVPRDKVEYIRLIISNAKALEKEQIIEAYIESDSINASWNLEQLKSWAKDYYNETYGGDK